MYNGELNAFSTRQSKSDSEITRNRCINVKYSSSLCKHTVNYINFVI